MKKFKVEFYPTVFAPKPWSMEFDTKEEADTALLAVSLYDIFLDDNGYRSIDANSGCVYENIDGEWVEIEEEY